MADRHPVGWLMAGVAVVILAGLYVLLLVAWPVIAAALTSYGVVALAAWWLPNRGLRAELEEARTLHSALNSSEVRDDLAEVGPVTPPRGTDDPGIEPWVSSGYLPPGPVMELTEVYGFVHWTDGEGGGIEDPTQPCGWSNGDTVCGDPSAGTVTWPGQGPVPLCADHLAWARKEVDG